MSDDTSTSGKTSASDDQTKDFQDLIQEHADKDIDEETQQLLNKPLEKKAVTVKHQKYLQLILDLIDNGDIDVYVPETILNKKFYDSLKKTDKNKVDATLVNLAHMLQRLVYLREKKELGSFQAESLVESIWRAKENVESVIGDVYKI